jgi:hypothetical protein
MFLEPLSNLPPTGIAILLTMGLAATVLSAVAMMVTEKTMLPTCALVFFMLALSAVIQACSGYLT